jgi:allophanate hydrolase subunit 1
MAKKTVGMHVKFSEELHQKLVEEAASRDITMSELVRELCESGLGMRVYYKGRVLDKEEYFQYLRDFLSTPAVTEQDEKLLGELVMVGVPFFRGMSAMEFSQLLINLAKK